MQQCATPAQPPSLASTLPHHPTQIPRLASQCLNEPTSEVEAVAEEEEATEEAAAEEEVDIRARSKKDLRRKIFLTCQSIWTRRSVSSSMVAEKVFPFDGAYICALLISSSHRNAQGLRSAHEPCVGRRKRGYARYEGQVCVSRRNTKLTTN